MLLCYKNKALKTCTNQQQCLFSDCGGVALNGMFGQCYGCVFQNQFKTIIQLYYSLAWLAFLLLLKVYFNSHGKHLTLTQVIFCYGNYFHSSIFFHDSIKHWLWIHLFCSMTNISFLEISLLLLFLSL